MSGRFEGTSVAFSVYLPPAEKWEGRFYQYTYPMPIPGVWEGPEATERALGFALSQGGYAVQAGSATEVTLGYEHAAAVAQLGRELAREFYACPEQRIFGYLYGPSGGSFQTVGALELTDGIWDGFVPMVLGTPVSIPGNFFIRAMARMILTDKAEQIADAVRPGGSGDPFARLDEAETSMLTEMLDYGTPLVAWAHPRYLLGFEDLHGEPVQDPLMGMGDVVRQFDPSYVEDFWAKPGHLGTEQSPLGERVRARLAQVGDTAENRWAIALPSYYRHQVPSAAPDMYGFDQFRRPDGTPKYPQRPIEVGPIMQQQTTGGATYSGEISGKVIVVDTLGDSDALPWHADWFAGRVRRRLGDAFDDRFRLYFHQASDHHEQPVTGYRATHLVDYIGAVEQALIDLAAWVERDEPAPASTRYEVERSQVRVPARAVARQGIQPVARIEARIVADRREVLLSVYAEAPIGEIVEIAWDLDGAGQYTPHDFGAPAPKVETTRSHTFPASGTYLVAVRVTSHRAGDPAATYGRVHNLERVRVEVP